MSKLVIKFHFKDSDKVLSVFETYETLTEIEKIREMDVGDSYGKGDRELRSLYLQDVNFIALGIGIECGARAMISMNERVVETAIDEFGRFVVGVEGFTESGLVYDDGDKEEALGFLKLRQRLIERWGVSHVMDEMSHDGEGREDDEREPESFIEAIEEAEGKIGAALTKLLNLTDSAFDSMQVRTLTNSRGANRKKKEEVKVTVFVNVKEK